MISNKDEEDFFGYIDDGKIDKIREVLENNIKICEIWKYESKENDDSTVLHISVFKNLYEITEMIINFCKEKNNDGLEDFINKKNNKGTIAIHFAAFNGNVKMMKLLIDNGGDIYAKTNNNLNIIHYSAQGNKPTSLMYFYLNYYYFAPEKEQNIIEFIKAKDSGGSTPLHWAAYSRAENMLLYLINLKIFKNEKEKDEFINQQDNNGLTPLHISVRSNCIRIVMKLLQSGANIEIKDKSGKTPLNLAINKKFKDIEEVLKNNQKCDMCNFKAPVKQIKKSSINIFVVFITQFISLFILFSSIISIAFNTSLNDKNIFYDTYFVIYLITLVIFFILYIGLLIINPGRIHKQNENYINELIKKGENLNQYCYECYIEKSEERKHCIICHRCYENFDHHCFWINKCIAKNNYCIFLCFLIEPFLYLAVALGIGILGIIHLIKGNNGEKYIYYNSFIKFTFRSDFLFHNYKYYYALNIILISLNVFFLIPETLLLILHLHIYLSDYRAKKIAKQKNRAIGISLMKEEGNNFL